MKKTLSASTALLALLFVVGCQSASPFVGDWKIDQPPQGVKSGALHVDAKGTFCVQISTESGNTTAGGGQWICDKENHAVATVEGEKAKGHFLIVGENRLAMGGDADAKTSVVFVRQQAENK